MTIVWLAINASYSHSSLALPLLHEAARGHVAADWALVAATVNDDALALAAAVDRHAPEVLAGTVYLFNRNLLLDVVRRLHALRPQCRIILGGPEFLGANEAFLRAEPAVAAVLRGEGEDAFPLWLECPNTLELWPDVPGLCYLDHAGRYHDNGRATVSKDTFATLRPERSPFFDLAKPFVQIETTRGCTATCSFCTSAHSGPITPLPWRRVTELLAHLRQAGTREIRLLDRTFNLNPRRAGRFLRHLRDEHPELRVHLEVHPALLPDALRAAFAAARPGQLHLELGLQTTDAEALRLSARPGAAGDAWDGVRFLCGLRNLACHVDLLAGLPGTTLDGLLDDVTRLACLGPAEIQLETLKVLPGTALAAQARALGVVAAPDPPYDVMRTPHMSVDDLEHAARLARVLDLFYNTHPLQCAVRTAASRDDRFFRDMLGWADAERASLHGLGIEKRFRHLHRFLADRDRDASEMLERAWMRHGLSPHDGLATAAPWKSALPSDARCIEGDNGIATARGRRVWHLAQTRAEYWFVTAAASRQGGGPTVFARSRDPGHRMAPE